MEQVTFTWRGSRNLKIFAQSWAPDSSPRSVILLVHGLGEHSGRYQNLVEAFTKAGHAVLSFDLPGHGRSEGKRGHSSFSEIASEIDRLLDQAARSYPGKPVFLYGQSLGGELVFYYLLKNLPNIQGAVVTSPVLTPGVPVPAWKLLVARALNKLVPHFTLASDLDQTRLSRDPNIVRNYSQDPLVHDQVSASLGWDLLEYGKWIMENAGKISIPLLVVQGSDDRIVSPQATRQFAQLAPADKVTLKVWEGIYHEPHNEPEKEQVIQHILDWISAQISPSGSTSGSIGLDRT